MVRDLPHRLPALQAVIFEIFPSFLQDLGSAVVVDELHRMRAWINEQAIATAPSPVTEEAPVLTFRSVDNVTQLAAMGGQWQLRRAGGLLPFPFSLSSRAGFSSSGRALLSIRSRAWRSGVSRSKRSPLTHAHRSSGPPPTRRGSLV